MGVALLVLCLAVGGTAYAASQITGKQIANGTITSADIKDKTLKTKDISKKAKDSLRGQTGPKGAQGVQGVPGPSNAFAVRRSDGLPTPQAAGATVGVKQLVLAPGNYTVVSKIGIDDTSGAPRTVECQMLIGAAIVDSTFVTVSGTAGGWVCPNMAALTLTAATTTVGVRVLTPAASQVRLLPNAVIMATRVGSLTSTSSGGVG